MGGQACVLYGAAEFSKDFDFVLLLDSDNLVRFGEFIAEAQATVIAVPPFEVDFLVRGHAVHFRAAAPGLEQLRIDIMSTLPKVAPFPVLWGRRTTAEILPGLTVEVLALDDLVQAKKTQRDKDWPMIRRLVDVDYLRHRQTATPTMARFWLSELRSAALLVECAARWQEIVYEVLPHRREVLSGALQASEPAIEIALLEEEKRIRIEDKAYWAPRMKELEELRHRRKGKV